MLIKEITVSDLFELRSFADFSPAGLEAIIDFFKESDCDIDTRFDKSIAWEFLEFDSLEEATEDRFHTDMIKDDMTEHGIELTEENIQKAYLNKFKNWTWCRVLENGHFIYRIF
jgi:hypothetical protein